MKIKHEKTFGYGYNEIVSKDKYKHLLMDFGIVKLNSGQSIDFLEEKESAYTLIQGKITFKWEDKETTVERKSCFNDYPICLHLPADIKVSMTGILKDAEIAVSMTENKKRFTPVLYMGKDSENEIRGKGTLGETATRIVRTYIDDSKAPYSNFVIGEVINYPGKWSSWPPHRHPQPEIYFYKFLPDTGFGYSELGEDVYKIKNNDTIIIPEDLTHPQTSAPGYGMYYYWVIRHLECNRYIKPSPISEHTWTTKPGAKVFPDKL